MSKIGIGLLSLFLLLLAIPANAQDTSHIAIVTKDSAYHYPKDTLATYEFYPRQHPTKGFLENDFAFGGTAGTPGGLNFIAEKYFHQFGVRAEFGAFGLVPFFLIAGYQADLCYVLLRDKNELMECTIFYTNTFTSSVDDNPGGSSAPSVGASLAFNAGGFFIQAGFIASFFKAYFQHGFLPSIFQIGYVH